MTFAATAGTAVDTVRPAWRAARPYLVVLLISTAVVSQWFQSGTFVSTGDMGPFIRQGWAPEATWSWNHSVTGAGSSAYNVARGFEFLLIEVTRQFTGDDYGAAETVAQWLFYTVIYGLVGFGVAYLAGAFVRSEAAIVAAGLFGILNGFFLTRLPNPLNIISVGSIALLTGLAVRVAKGRRVPPPVFGFALIPTSFLGFNPPMLVVAYAWTALGIPVLVLLSLGWRPTVRLVWWFVRAAPWALLLNLWWLVPLAQSFTGGGGAEANAQFTDPTNWSWAQINNTVPNILTMVANWAWFRPQYLPFAESLDEPSWIWMRYLLPAAVVIAPVLALRAQRRVALVVAGLAGVVVFLAKGLMPPFGDINLWLYLNMPGFWLFREPMSKLGQLLIMFFAVLIALLAEGVLTRVRERMAQRRPAALVTGPRALLGLPRLDPLGSAGVGFTAVAIVGVLAYPTPLYTGAVIPDVRPEQPSAHVRVPDYWWELAEHLNADPAPGKVLLLPLDDYYQMPTTWGFFGVDSVANLLSTKPVVQRKPDGYFGDRPGFAANVNAVETALTSGDLDAVRPLLDAIGVAYVIVRHDLMRGVEGRTFVDDRILDAAMQRIPGMTRVISGPLDLWKVDDADRSEVRSYARLVTAPQARPVAGAAAIPSLAAGEALLSDTGPAVDSSPSAPDPGPAVSEDVVSWPVPALDGDTARTTVSLPAGRYRVDQRARAAAVLAPRVDPAAGELVLEDTTQIRVDGEVVSERPPLRLAVPRSDVVAVRAGGRTVSLDGWGRSVLPGGSAPATLPVGSATALTAFAPAARPAQVTPLSEVYDCNNYEPRPAEELRLRRTVTDTPQGEVVRLSADDHAACVRVEVADAAPGKTYRVRVEYRQIEGKRPQVCVWQVGTEGCALAPRPQLGGQWTPFETVVTVDEVAEGLQVVLHADVGERFLGRTVTEYRGLTVEALDPVLESTVWPPAVPTRFVELAAGEHQLSVTGGLAGSVLAPFEPLQDCFRYDDLTPEEAGLSVEELGYGEEPSFALEARVHMACLGATIPDMGASSLYELALEARSVRIRNPKFCVYLRGPDRCQKLPIPSPWDGWTPYRALFAPNDNAVETRLYLLGLRDLEGKEVSRVEYRQVGLRPVASPSTVVLVRQAEGPAAAVSTPEATRLNPATYRVERHQTAPTGAIGVTETWAPGWSARTGGSSAGGTGETWEHVMLQGWMNAWVPDGQGSAVLEERAQESQGAHTAGSTQPAGTAQPAGSTQASATAPDALGPASDSSLTFSYAPARTARLALLLLPVAVVAAVCWMLAARGVRLLVWPRIGPVILSRQPRVPWRRSVS